MEPNPQDLWGKKISNLDSLEILNVYVPLTKKRKVVYSDFNEFYFFPKCLRLDFSNHIGSQVLSVLCLRPEKKEQGLLQLYLLNWCESPRDSADAQRFSCKTSDIYKINTLDDILQIRGNMSLDNPFI